MLGKRARAPRWAAGLLAMGTGVAPVAAAPADPVMMVLSLASFTEWPAEATYGATFRICLRDDDPAIARFTGALSKTLGPRKVSVHTVAPSALTQRPCHAAYFSSGYAEAATMHALAKLPVLTVSPQPGFAGMGGLVELSPEGEERSLMVSAATITDHRLKISAQLLSMAKVLP